MAPKISIEIVENGFILEEIGRDADGGPYESKVYVFDRVVDLTTHLGQRLMELMNESEE